MDIIWDNNVVLPEKLTHIVEKNAYTQDNFTCRISVRTGAVKLLNRSKNTITYMDSLKEVHKNEKYDCILRVGL